MEGFYHYCRVTSDFGPEHLSTMPYIDIVIERLHLAFIFYNITYINRFICSVCAVCLLLLNAIRLLEGGCVERILYVFR